MNKPYFSVVIPLYNKKRYIERTIHSVLNQTYNNFEILVIDDGSKDDSPEIVRNINDSRVRLITQSNGGPSKARNTGIKNAHGKFIAFLDADDEWLPTKLEKHYKLHTMNKELLWSCSAFEAIGGKRYETIVYKKEGVLENSLENIMNGLVVQTSSVIIKKEVFKNERLLFNEAYKRSEDREVWYKLACLYPNLGYFKEVLMRYYVETDGSLNATGLNENDFPFLSLESRIEKELSSVSKEQKDKFTKYLNQLKLERLLTIWGWSDAYKNVIDNFTLHINHNVLSLLKLLNFLPKIIKKILVKIYLIVRSN